MRPNVILFAAELLELAADEFANHGCNDLRWPSYMTAEDRAQVFGVFLRNNEDYDVDDTARGCTPGDAAMMCTCAAMLRDLAGGAT